MGVTFTAPLSLITIVKACFLLLPFYPYPMSSGSDSLVGML